MGNIGGKYHSWKPEILAAEYWLAKIYNEKAVPIAVARMTKRNQPTLARSRFSTRMVLTSATRKATTRLS